MTKTEHVPNAEKETFVSDCQTNCYQSFGFRFGESLQIFLFVGFFRMIGEIMFDKTLTIVISHYCIFTEALPRLIPRGFRLLSFLPRLRFSSHRGEFAAITFGKDEVLPRANGPIVSSGTVYPLTHTIIIISIEIYEISTSLKIFNILRETRPHIGLPTVSFFSGK